MVAKKKKTEMTSNAEQSFLARFNQNKSWVAALRKLLTSQEKIHRRDIEALEARKYFMRDQIDRLITLGVVSVHARNNKNQPIVLKSQIFKEDKKE